MLRGIIVILFLSCSIMASSQQGGLRVSGGLTLMENNDAVLSATDSQHSGYHVGVDGRLMSGGMSFLLGAKYTQVSRFPEPSIKLTGHDNSLTFISGRVGLGFTLVSFGDNIRLRSKLLGNLSSVVSVSGERSLPSDVTLNDGWLSGITGLGLDVGPLAIDLEYEHGLVNAYYKRKGSTFNSWALSVGFFF